MKETVSVVNLKCLNCGANLEISNNISEFACSYCGANQIVHRSGGIVTLELLSSKIDRVQSSIDKTAAELKIQRYKGELQELEEKHTNLDESAIKMKSMINPLAITLMVAAVFPFLILAGYTSSPIPLILGGAVEVILFIIWRNQINKIDLKFGRTSKALIEKGVQLRKKILELEKIVEN